MLAARRLVLADESFDHRSRWKTLAKFARYIEQNPVKARLPKSDFRYGAGGGVLTRQRKPGRPIGTRWNQVRSPM